jgi:UDPglucose 6-dehydrogenase
MAKPTVAVIGSEGALGAATRNLFPSTVVAFDVSDRYIGGTEAQQKRVSACDVAFVCVPTPARPDGSCDTSIVDNVVGWCGAGIIVIKSTVSVGTVDRLQREHDKAIVFQPEFGPGETPDHPFADLRDQRWVILGGVEEDTAAIADLYQTVYRSDLIIARTNARTAELVKYMENAYLATKVAFCNEMHDIAWALDVSYIEARELWLLDPRIGRSHTFVGAGRIGFGGKCLPKDLAALIATATNAGVETSVLSAVQEWATN